MLLSFLALGVQAVMAQCSGTAGFSGPGAYAPLAGSNVTSIANADFDGDGAPDLVACAGSQIAFLRNQGDGTFVPGASVSAPCILADLAVGDFDFDGLPDVAAVGTAVTPGPTGTTVQGWVVVIRNQTPAAGLPLSFTPAAPMAFGIPGTPSVGRAIRTADIEADGITDLVVVDAASPTAWILRGHGGFGCGDGTFHPAVPHQTGGAFLQDVAIGDLNQDGAPDLAFIQYGGCNCPTSIIVLGGVTAPNGLPTGAFAPAATIPIPGPSACESILAVDVNADGFLDLVASSYLSIEIARGAGGFSFTTTSHPTGPYPLETVAGDFSGDGMIDLVVARNASTATGYGDFSILTGQPGGLSGFVPLALSTGYPQCVTTADFDGDGGLDLAAGLAFGSVNVVFGTCTAAVPRTVSVAAPNGGEILPPGPTTITWTASPTVPLVDVDVSRDGGSGWHRIATNVAGTSCSWIVGEPGTTDALLRVSASGAPSIADVSDAPFTIAANGAAAVSALGAGCGSTGHFPTLSFGTPRLGHAAPVSIHGASPYAIGGLVLSLVPPAPSIVGFGCTVYVDPGAFVILTQFVADGGGDWTWSALVPGVNQLAGLTVRAQVGMIVPPGAFELTNAVELTAGF